MDGDDYIGRSEFYPYYARLKDGRIIDLDLPADADGAAEKRYFRGVYDNNKRNYEEREIEIRKLLAILDNMKGKF